MKAILEKNTIMFTHFDILDKPVVAMMFNASDVAK
jgi:hypothetical protein